MVSTGLQKTREQNQVNNKGINSGPKSGYLTSVLKKKGDNKTTKPRRGPQYAGSVYCTGCKLKKRSRISTEQSPKSNNINKSCMSIR